MRTNSQADKEIARPCWLLRLLQVAVTIGLIAYILYKVPLGDAWAITLEAEPRHLGLGLLSVLGAYLTFIFRWHVLLRPIGVTHSFLHTLGLGLIGIFYNSFMPSTLGGDAAKSYLVARGHEVRAPQVVASVVTDRVLGLVALLIMGFAVTFVISLPGIRKLLLAFVGVALVFFLLVILMARAARGKPGDHEEDSRRHWLGTVIEKATETAQALIHYRKYKLHLAAGIIISCVGILLAGLTFKLWCLAFAFDLSLAEGVAVTVAMSVVTMLPITVNGLGLAEGTNIVLLVAAGVGQPAALGIAVLQRVAVTLLGLLGGGLQLLPKPYRPTF